MKLPGHDITMEEFTRRCENIRGMSPAQLALMTRRGKEAYIRGVFKRAKDEELIDELVRRGYHITKEEGNDQ